METSGKRVGGERPIFGGERPIFGSAASPTATMMKELAIFGVLVMASIAWTEATSSADRPLYEGE